VALAGVESGVLGAILSNVTEPEDPVEKAWLSVSGFVQNVHLDWADLALKVGDRLEITLVEGEPDPPARERPEPVEGDEESYRRYSEQLKQKFEPKA